MAVVDAAVLSDALKRVWTQDKLEAQFYAETPLFERLKRRSDYDIGELARVPIESAPGAGYTAYADSGTATLNAAGTLNIDAADYTYKNHAVQIDLTVPALVRSNSSVKSVVNALDQKVLDATRRMRREINRQLYMDGTALIAQCDSGGASTTVELRASQGDLGYDAIVRGWLYPGQLIDIGTTSDEDAIVGDAVIASVSESVTDPDIVIDSSVTTTTSHYVSVANARSGATSNELGGLPKIVSNTAVLGTLDPATVPFWKPADVDATSQAFSLPLAYAEQRKVRQKTGADPTFLVTSLAQREAVYRELQSQVRFMGDGKLGAGNMDNLRLGGSEVIADNDCPDKYMFFLSEKNMFMVRTGEPFWQDQYSGGKGLEWVAGTPRFSAALFYFAELATNRRNAHAALTNLQRPS